LNGVLGENVLMVGDQDQKLLLKQLLVQELPVLNLPPKKKNVSIVCWNGWNGPSAVAATVKGGRKLPQKLSEREHLVHNQKLNTKIAPTVLLKWEHGAHAQMVLDLEPKLF